MSLCHANFFVHFQLYSRYGRQTLPGASLPASAMLRPLGRFPLSNHLKFAIALPLRNGLALTQLLHEVSDPASPNFRHYLKPQEFAARFAPQESDYQAVIAFAYEGAQFHSAEEAERH